MLIRILCPSITKAACQRLLRSRLYTRTSLASIRCVSSRSCRMSSSLHQHYGSMNQQVYQSVCLEHELSVVQIAHHHYLIDRLLRDTKVGKRPFVAVCMEVCFADKAGSVDRQDGRKPDLCCARKLNWQLEESGSSGLRLSFFDVQTQLTAAVRPLYRFSATRLKPALRTWPRPCDRGHKVIMAASSRYNHHGRRA